MLYMKVLVAVVVVGVGVRLDDEDREVFHVSGSADTTKSTRDSLQSLEKKVIARMMGKSDPTLKPVTNSDFSAEVTKLLEGMKSGTKTSNEAAQKAINTSFAKFASCTSIYATGKNKVKKSQEDFLGKKTPHTTCRTAEEENWIIKDTCEKKVGVLNGEHDKCNLEIATQSATDARPATCKEESTTESELDWLIRMEAGFVSKLATWRSKIANCQKKGAELQKEMLACEATTKTYNNKQKECDALGVQMDQQACRTTTTSMNECNAQGTCYAGAVTAYTLTTTTAEQQEKDHMVEHRLWKRIECLLGALGTQTAGTADKDALEKCIAAKYSTDAVKLTYHAKPAKPDCQAHPAAPCAEDYTKVAYTPLPEHAKGHCTPCPLPVFPTAA